MSFFYFYFLFFKNLLKKRCHGKRYNSCESLTCIGYQFTLALNVCSNLAAKPAEISGLM
uniref:Uncharacterized protein n=1 Tax=Anguilla anguilla TaxID=7936 RepID=A0A0E9X494_ANGAN